MAATLLAVATAASDVWADTAGERYALATGYYSQRRWPEAVAEFRKLLDEYPQYADVDSVRFLLGESLVQTGQYRAAHSLYAEFLRNQPNHRFTPQAQFRAGETAYLLGQHELARQHLKRFHQKFATNPLCAYAVPYLGDLALHAGDVDEAKEMYHAALQQFPDGPLVDQCRFGLGRTFELQGNDAEAHRFFQFLGNNLRSPFADDALLQQGLLYFGRKQHAQAQESLDRLIAKLPDSPLAAEAGYWLGLSQSEEEKWDEAAGSLSKAAESVDDGHRLAPAIHFAAAEALRRIGQVDAAVSMYAGVVNDWPECPWAADSLQAQIQIAFDQHDHALIEELAGEFEQRFSTNRLAPLVRETLGRSLLRREEYDRAVEVFAKLVDDAADPSAIDNYRYLLGLSYVGAKQYAAAIEQLDQIDTAAAPDELAAGVELARASALVALNDHARAVEAQQGYLRLDSASAEAAKIRTQLVISLAKSGQIDEAAKVHEELIAGAPDGDDFAATTQFLADTAFAKERYELSRNLYTQLAAAAEDDLAAEGLAGLAWSRAKLGEAVESAEAFAQLLDRFPGSQHAAEAGVMAARQLQELGKIDEAILLYERVINDYADSEFFPQAVLAAASYYETDGNDKPKAAELLARLEKEKPELPELDAVLYQRAWILVDLNQPEEADEIFRKLYEQHPHSEYWGDATYRLAERAARANDNASALQLADELIESNVEGHVRCHATYLKGQLAAINENWNEVAERMQQVVAEFPDSSLRIPADYWVAEAEYRLGEFDDAAPRFERLANETRGRQEPWLAIIVLRRAQILAQQEKWLDAYELASGIDRQYPNFRQQYEVDYLLGRCLANRAEFGAAREAYERVIRSSSGSRTETAAMAQWMIGESHLHQKNYDEAIRAYHRVETLYAYPRWQAAALLQAGKCHEAKGEWQSAVQLYALLLQKYPDTTFTEEASQRLRTAREKTTSFNRVPNGPRGS